MTEWYAASLLEISSLLDLFEENESVTISREDDVVAALIAMLGAGVVISVTAGALDAAHRTLRRLET